MESSRSGGRRSQFTRCAAAFGFVASLWLSPAHVALPLRQRLRQLPPHRGLLLRCQWGEPTSDRRLHPSEGDGPGLLAPLLAWDRSGDLPG